MLEKDIQKKIINEITKRNGYLVKNIIVNKRGVADITMCYRGYYVAIEVKAPDKKDNESRLQELNRRQVTHSSGLSVVVWKLSQLKEVLNYLESIPRILHDFKFTEEE